MATTQVGTTPQFRSAVQALDRQAQGEVFTAAMKVVEGHPSAHVHKLEGCDYVAFGVNRNALRVICLREADLLILLHVGPHDAAYDWAKRHRTVRVGHVVRFVDVPTEEPSAPSESSQAEALKGPLADVRDRVFAKFGVGSHAARTLRRATTDDELIELAEHLAHPLNEAIVALATDPDDLAGILRAFEDARRAPRLPLPLADALRADVNAGSVWLPPTDHALEAALTGDLDDWRLFLHPAQQRLVRWRVKGAVKVTGGPGTGKTVVALHRARFLAERVFPEDARPVALATFSRTLAEQLEGLVDGLCADAPAVRAKIEVRTLTDLAREVLRRAGQPATVAPDEVIDAAWRTALAHDALGWTRKTYEAEREHVVAHQGAWTEAAYVAALRAGRSSRLDRARKRQVWRVLAAFEAALAESGSGDPLALARDATAAIEAGAASPWAALVVDEMQDASAAQLRMVAALTHDPQTGGVGADRLLLVGDGYQRLYASPVSLASCGIEVRGRSRRLRLNYRTTEGIRRAAIGVVQGLAVDALEDVAEGEDTPFDGYRSVRGGPVPEHRRFATPEAEAAWIAEQASDGLLVLARTSSYRDALARRLEAHGLPVHVLEGKGSLAPQGITLCTLHRSKGLEAARVVVAGAQLVPSRFPGGDEADRRLHERREQCLLYVGMTRARDWCAVTRVGG